MTSKISRPRSSVISRRRMLALAATGVAVAATPLRPLLAKDKEVVYATFGGSWEAAMRKSWFDPFAKTTGIPVKTVTGPDYGKIRAMVKANNTEWDIAEVNPDFQFIGAKEGLLEPLDFKVIDTSEIMKVPDLVTPYSVPQNLWSKTMSYNTKLFSAENHPKTWAEFWDVKKFPGKRALYAKVTGGTLEYALLADGVAPDKLYPLDVDRALKSLDKIKDHVLWYDTHPQAIEMMTSGRAGLGGMADGRVLAAVAQGAPLAIEYNQSLLDWMTFVVPKGAPNKESAMKLLAYMVSVDAQTAVTDAFTYGPITPKSYEKIKKDRAMLLSGGPQQQGKYVMVNNKWWGENRDKVSEKYDAWRLK